MVKVLGPNNPKAKEFLQKEQGKVDYWIQYADADYWNHVSKWKKNRYLQKKFPAFGPFFVDQQLEIGIDRIRVYNDAGKNELNSNLLYH